MRKIALCLYKMIISFNGHAVYMGKVKEDLLHLNHGKDITGVMENYYVKKITFAVLIVVIGMLLGGVIRYSAARNTKIVAEEGIMRQEAGSEAQKITLCADDGETQKTYTVEVSPRRYTEDEISNYEEKFLGDVAKYILGENRDLDHVTGNLRLENTYDGLPFYMSWESSNPEYLTNNGMVAEVTEPKTILLTVTMNYEDIHRQEEIRVRLTPPVISREIRDYRELKQYLLESEKECREEKQWKLPREWKGRPLNWSMDYRDYSIPVWLGTPLLALLLFFQSDKDLHTKVEKRQKELRRDFPDIVHKLALYIGAGLTIRKAFERIGHEYETKPPSEKARLPGHQEILYTYREMQAGVSEYKAYENLGKRTGLREYMKLCGLLEQGVTKGNAILTQRLREEAERASADVLLRMREQVEEAGTKMLIPMIMLLFEIMVMIMIPAFQVI